MNVSPAPSKTHVSVPGSANEQRTLAMRISKGAIEDFRSHMLSFPGISDSERRMHAEHKMPADECVASAALFELRHRRNELAPQAAKLESSLDSARTEREKIAQELFKNRNKFDSLVDMVSEAGALASKSKGAIAAAQKDAAALGASAAAINIVAQIALESFGDMALQSKRDPKDLEKALRRSGYAHFAEIAELCEMSASFLSNAYRDLQPRADLLCEGTSSGLRILQLAERAEIEAFANIMAKSLDSANGNSHDKSNFVYVQSETAKSISRLNSLAAAVGKASAEYFKMEKRAASKGTDPEDYGQFVTAAREASGQLSAFIGIARDMVAAKGKYALVMGKLVSLVNEQAALEESLSQLPDTSGDEKLLSQMRQELSDLDLLERAVNAELSRLSGRRLEKEAKRSVHAQNRLSREEWERVKSGGEPAKPRFTYSKEPQAEPAMIDAAEARKQKFVEAALSLFESSLNKNAMLREQFEATLSELAELYLKGKGSITSKSLFGRFPKRTKHEKVFRNDANEYDIVRVGFSSINEYRLLIDVKNSRQPLIYFVGHKEECEAFMKAMPRKISGCREKALSNGVGSLFAILSPE